MKKNNFQRLEEVAGWNLPSREKERIRRSVHGRISLARMAGQIADLYISNFLLAFSDLFDGGHPQDADRFPDPPSRT